MIDFRQVSNPLKKRLSTTVPRDLNQTFTIPRKTLSTAGACEGALPPIKKRKVSSLPSEEPNPSDQVKNIVRLREAIGNRTLFCHNAPDVPGFQFKQNFQVMMHDTELSFYENLITHYSKSGPHEFKLVFVNADMATRALNLNGFTLQDRTSINLRRPPEYNGPPVTHKITWNEFAATRSQSDINNIRNEKNEREVYVKNVPLNTNHHALSEFLGDAMQRASLNICQGNPIIWCKVKRSTGFISFRTSEEAAAILSLNNIQFCGARLLFERGRNKVGRYQNLHHDPLEIPFAKDTHRAPCPQRLERGNFELQGSQSSASVLSPTSGDGSCCSLVSQDLPSNHDYTSVDLTDEDHLSTPPLRPKKSVTFSLKEEGEGCGTSDGKAKHQTCAKVGEKSTTPALPTQDCRTTIDEQHTHFVLSVLDQANQDREGLKRQLEETNVEVAQLQQQLSEMAKRLAESDASRASFEKSAFSEKRELLARQQQLVIMHKVQRTTTHELEEIRQQLQKAIEENIMQAASIHFDKPLLVPSIKQEESFVKCEGRIQYTTSSEQVRALVREEEELWDV